MYIYYIKYTYILAQRIYIYIYKHRGSFSPNVYMNTSNIYLYVFLYFCTVFISSRHLFFFISLCKITVLHNHSAFSFHRISATVQEILNIKSLINNTNLCTDIFSYQTSQVRNNQSRSCLQKNYLCLLVNILSKLASSSKDITINITQHLIVFFRLENSKQQDSEKVFLLKIYSHLL